MALAPGSRLGPYEVVAEIGAGGMGVVYKARDTRLGRDVAIKVLPPGAAGDQEHRDRFAREAKLIASLEHPNICSLHDVGRQGDVDYLVMPYLSGETLSTRLKRGPLPVAQALDIARQIADALDRAHRHGIVHRDLKPGNVMLTVSGVRLLDFGLARVQEPAAGHPDEVVTRSVLTMPGAVMGTLPYMAPEQLAGKAADTRSDIWAFGCVLYEMLAGRRPFDGDSPPAIITAIMSSEPPPLSQQAAGISRSLVGIVNAALAKDVEERWQSLRDVKRALSLATAENVEPAVTASRRSTRALYLLLTALGAAVVGLGIFAGLSWRRTPAPALVRFDVNAIGTGTIARYTDVTPYFAVSPDGTRIAYVATVDGQSDIWIKRVDTDAPERLADTRGATGPFWSPDSQSIAYFAGSTLKRRTLAGGAARSLCAVEANSSGLNGAWSPNGVILVAEWTLRKIVRVAEDGGAVADVRTGERALGWPSFLPDGKHFLFTTLAAPGQETQAYVASLDSTDAVAIPGVSSRAEFSNGRLIFWRDGSLVAQPFDPGTLRLTGVPAALAAGVHAFTLTGFAAFSASPGLLAYQAGATNARLAWADRRGLETDAVGPPMDYGTVHLSPDALKAATSVRDPILGTNDVYIHDFERSVTQRFTTDPGTENAPMWSPDGRRIVFAAPTGKNAPTVVSRALDGTGAQQAVAPPASAGPQVPGAFTADGAWLVYTELSEGTGYDLMLAPTDGHEPPRAIVRSPGFDGTGAISPNGKWVAYSSAMSGRREVYVQALHDGHGRRQISADGGYRPTWRGDGKELYYLTGADRERVMLVDIADHGDAIDVGTPKTLFVRHTPTTDYDVAPDGQRFLFINPDLVAERGTLSVALNWARLLPDR